jgi:hypothetical protein
MQDVFRMSLFTILLLFTLYENKVFLTAAPPSREAKKRGAKMFSPRDTDLLSLSLPDK